MLQTIRYVGGLHNIMAWVVLQKGLEVLPRGGLKPND